MKYIYKGLQFESKSLNVIVDKRLINLTLKKLRLLLLFLINQDKVLSKKEILSMVWNYETGDCRNLETHIKTLFLKKIRLYDNNIITVHGLCFYTKLFKSIELF